MSDALMPESGELLRMLDEATARWHVESSSGLDGVLALHRANFDLWHEEDEARNPDATDARIAEVKRAIDKLNQRRNDLVEGIDVSLSEVMPQAETSPLHSETPTMILDRLSIMSLKLYHTREETVRVGATQAHREKNVARLAVLAEQRKNLAECLDVLMDQIRRGQRRFKVYRQMKMYNDPELNPVLYRRGGG